jgi:trimethylamine--corrinoid protein Co-methyltransferase
MTRSVGRRRAAAQERGAGALRQAPWRPLELAHRPLEIVSEDAIEAIHQASLEILESLGMKVLDPRARAVLKAEGAEVDEGEQVVRLDRALVEAKLRLAPSEFTLRARNPARDFRLGGRHAAYSSVGGPAYVADLDRGRRPGSFVEMCDFLRLVQSLNIVHQEGGGPFEPLDLPAETRHLDQYYAQITLLDKNWQPWGLGSSRALDALEMAAIAFGTTREQLADHTIFACIINTNSPLVIDVPMAEGLMAMAQHGQAVVVTPFTLAGAMCPVTLAGALAQQNAEALAGIALVQSVRPGAPVVYGGFTTNVDMKSGAPAFGTPEYAQAAQISGQLARRHRLPFRSSAVTTANTVDAQAAYETMMSLWGAVTGHAHLIVHAGGWLGGGLTASFEKLIVDAEMMQMMAAWLQPPAVDRDSLGLAAIREVGHAGHFFGTAHTLARYQTAFYAPLISDWDNYDSWQQRGGLGTAERANRLWKAALAEYQPPPLDPAIDEALRDYVARRKRALGQPRGAEAPGAA